MKKDNKPSPLKIPAQLIAGAVQTGIGLIGNKKRKRALARAQGAYDMQKQRFENMDTSNPYANMENVYEDATINTQEADMIKQQQMQQQSNMMDQFGQAAGGSGIAALAQAMSQQQSQNAQQAAASIGQQEAANQAAAARQAAQLQSMEAQGAARSQDMQMNKISTQLGMAQERLGAANAAREAAKQQVISGVGDVGNAVAGYGGNMHNFVFGG